MKKDKTIYILPKLERGFSDEDFDRHLELAETIDYVPDSIKTLQRIDFYDLKYLMEYNDNFFNSVVEMCSETIDEMIADAKKESRARKVQKAVTLEDLLKSGYYDKDYDIARDEFIYSFQSFYLGDIGKKRKTKKKAPMMVEMDLSKGITISKEEIEKALEAKTVSEVPDKCKSIFEKLNINLESIMVQNKTLKESISDMLMSISL